VEGVRGLSRNLPDRNARLRDCEMMWKACVDYLAISQIGMRDCEIATGCSGQECEIARLRDRPRTPCTPSRNLAFLSSRARLRDGPRTPSTPSRNLAISHSSCPQTHSTPSRNLAISHSCPQTPSTPSRNLAFLSTCTFHTISRSGIFDLSLYFSRFFAFLI